jgi:hypothetical protein
MNSAIYFSNFCRRNINDFEILLQLVGPKIAKSDSHFWKAIPENILCSLFDALGDKNLKPNSFVSLVHHH